MQNKFFYPLPKPYDILLGYFPERNKITPKNIEEDDLPPFEEVHFMLVLKVMKKEHRVIVVYLTSVKSKHINKGIALNQYIIIDPKKEIVGLDKDTLITFSKTDIASLKYNSIYFKEGYNVKEKRKMPIIGKLQADDIIEIEEYLKVTEIKSIIDQLENSRPIVPMLK